MSACVFCSLSYEFYFIGDKIAADNFKYEITPSLKANARLKFYQDATLNCAIYKEKIRYKLSYKVLNEEIGYYQFLDIYPFLILMQLKCFTGGIHHCGTVVGKWSFDSNFPFCASSHKRQFGLLLH